MARGCKGPLALAVDILPLWVIFCRFFPSESAEGGELLLLRFIMMCIPENYPIDS